MKQKPKKKFALNLIIAYYKTTNPDNYRAPIHNLLRNLAWLHGFDYAIESDTKIFDKVVDDKEGPMDIIYFRSGQHTSLSLREFQKVIEAIFLKSIASPFSAVDVFYQNQVFTKRYPFPSEFFRPLNYPFIELHKGLEKQLMVFKDALDFDIDLVPSQN